MKKRPEEFPNQDDLPEILPPSDDRIFKLLLTHGDAEPVLKSIVAAVLGRKVRKVLVRNNELPVEGVDEKRSRLDVNCVVEGGEQIDLEMQASRIRESGDGKHANLISKSIFYLCNLHSSQTMKGMDYTELAHTWQVTFCAYPVYPRSERFFHLSKLRDEDGNVTADDIALVLVELAKAARLAEKRLDELTPREVWTVFLGCVNRPEYRKVIEGIFRKNREVAMAGTLLKSISKDERERAIFRSRRMYQTDMESNLVTERKNGIAIGEKRGAERVRKQWDADRQETMRRMKAEGVSDDVIAKVMQLTPNREKKPGKRVKS